MGTRSFLPVLFLLLLSSCDFLFQGSDSVRYPPITVPNDQSSEDERDAVGKVLETIAQYASEFGQEVDFSKLPIIVRARDNPSENVAGRCHYDYEMKGHFIEIFKDVIPIRATSREKYYSPELFVVLLHEIGHCYYYRPHEAATIRKRGYEMAFTVPTDSGTGVVVFNEIPATIMIDTWSIGIPKSLERYYVGEVLGIQRANTPEELQAFVDFNLRPREDMIPPEPSEPPPPPEPDPEPPAEETPPEEDPWWPPWPDPSGGANPLDENRIIQFD
jgi:hypothetical protein